jgi:molybdenum cofactor biosynthesis enzyme MoaA
MKEFLPHLQELRINGGEPFAQKIVLDLCDVIAEVNPDLHVNIATNGTIYNKRVQKILDTVNVHLNVSIDSLIPERYEQIRINGKFEVLMKNFEIFKQYSFKRNRGLSVMVNPMKNNWDEMVNFVEFTDKHQCSLWYNTILYPRDLAIKWLPAEEISKIYTAMASQLEKVPMDTRNRDKAEHLIHNQIKNWILDAYEIAE